jgi:hypothetical protein
VAMLGGVLRYNCSEYLPPSAVVDICVHCYASSVRVNLQKGGTCQTVTVNTETKRIIT